MELSLLLYRSITEMQKKLKELSHKMTGQCTLCRNQFLYNLHSFAFAPVQCTAQYIQSKLDSCTNHVLASSTRFFYVRIVSEVASQFLSLLPSLPSLLLVDFVKCPLLIGCIKIWVNVLVLGGFPYDIQDHRRVRKAFFMFKIALQSLYWNDF
jgi:hypothetical protein